MQDKSIFFRLPKTGKEGFIVEYETRPHMYDKLHYHPEMQLIYILEGTGDLFVGDTFVSYEPGNLYLIGPNQSHVFKSDPVYFDDNKQLECKTISIFFHEQSLGNGFFSIEETSEIRSLLERSGRGIQFNPVVAESIGPKILKLLGLNGFDRLLEILSILNTLSTCEDFEYLATMNTPVPLSDLKNQKVNKVFNYIINNFHKDIKLEDVAKVANYSQAAFCHFFKQHTQKTFVQFLIELRVSNACKMLRNSDFNISQICYECGFNNVSNFNRQFKKITGVSPSAYIKKYEEKSLSWM
ncbi:MAG: AraC family transcriptional regulator [Balneolaceae bacterium]